MEVDIFNTGISRVIPVELYIGRSATGPKSVITFGENPVIGITKPARPVGVGVRRLSGGRVWRGVGVGVGIAIKSFVGKIVYPASINGLPGRAVLGSSPHTSAMRFVDQICMPVLFTSGSNIFCT